MTTRKLIAFGGDERLKQRTRKGRPNLAHDLFADVAFAEKLGISAHFMALMTAIAEGLPSHKYNLFSKNMLDNIKPGDDTIVKYHQCTHRILTHPIYGAQQHLAAETPAATTMSAIIKQLEAEINGTPVPSAQWEDLSNQALKASIGRAPQGTEGHTIATNAIQSAQVIAKVNATTGNQDNQALKDIEDIIYYAAHAAPDYPSWHQTVAEKLFEPTSPPQNTCTQ